MSLFYAIRFIHVNLTYMEDHRMRRIYLDPVERAFHSLSAPGHIIIQESFVINIDDLSLWINLLFRIMHNSY